MIRQTRKKHVQYSLSWRPSYKQKTGFRSKRIILSILDAKAKEIGWGVDGFLIYDTQVVPFANEVNSIITLDLIPTEKK